jgi:hypothetical protein
MEDNVFRKRKEGREPPIYTPGGTYLGSGSIIF